MSRFTNEQASHAALQLAATMAITEESILETVKESSQYLELGVDDEVALTVVKVFLLAHLMTGLGPVLAATLFAPHNRLALLMGVSLGGEPRSADGGLRQITDEATRAGWSKREVQHLRTLSREFATAAARLAPVVERLELAINREVTGEDGQGEAAEA